jgi:hypothetical protein
VVLTLSAESLLRWVGQEPGSAPPKSPALNLHPCLPLARTGRTLLGTSTGVTSRKLLFVRAPA